jgi:hypothetical protein
MVVNRVSDEVPFELIDGQQRMTTLFLLMCGMKHYLQAHNMQPYAIIEQSMHGNPSLTDDETRIRFMPLYRESQDLLCFLASDEGIKVNEQLLRRRFTADAQGVFATVLKAYATITKWLATAFTSEAVFKAYSRYLFTSVRVIRIQTLSMTDALQLFETINERGARLNPVDLLKSRLFMHAEEADFLQLSGEWSAMIRTIKKLNEKENALRFIRYVVISGYLSAHDDINSTRESVLHAWFINNAEIVGYREDAYRFIGHLQKQAELYVAIRRGLNSHGIATDGLQNINALSAANRQHIPLMMAGQHLSSALQKVLATELERAFFLNSITDGTPRTFETQFVALVMAIRESQTAEHLENLRAEINRFVTPNSVLQNFIQGLPEFGAGQGKPATMRYMMARMTRYMMDDEQSAIEDYMKKFELVPLIPFSAPRNSTPEQQLLHETAAKHVGNMILIEKKHADSIEAGRLTVAEAIERSESEYVMRFRVTRAASPRMHAIPAEGWTPRTVIARGEHLMRIANDIWR